METPSLPTISGAKNTFLLKKEKFWGSIGGLILAGLGVLVGLKVLPYIIAFLKMLIASFTLTVVAIGLGVLIVFLIMIMSQPKFWATMWYWATIFAKKFTSFMAHMAKTEVLMAYANEYLSKKMANIIAKISIVAEAQRTVENRYDLNAQQIEKDTGRCETLKKRSFKNGAWTNPNDQAKFNELSANVQQLTEMNKANEIRLERLRVTLQVLEKVRLSFDTRINSIRQFVQNLITDWQAAKATNDALQEATGAMTGTDAETEIFNDVVDLMREDINRFTGQADIATNLLMKATSDTDIDTAAAGDKMLARLQQMDDMAQGLLDQSTTQKTALESRNIRQVKDVLSQQQGVVTPLQVMPRTTSRKRNYLG